ncbi:MAG: ATP-binding protein [Patescibacteria group bacterium]|nr:ATP-binding protein [Patescibacteria group bacterium]
MLVITTSISGSGKDEYLKKVSDYAKVRGKKIKVYPVGDMLLEHAKDIHLQITEENVLNTNPEALSAIRSAVFEKIIRELPKVLKEYDAVFINIHAMFYWKKVFIRSWDPYYVSQLNPDVFMSVIDSTQLIQNRLITRKQWQANPLTGEEILLWRNVEVEMTASWAEMVRKPHWIMPVNAPEKVMYDVLFEPNRESVYTAMPMTNLKDQKMVKKIDNFIDKLMDKFIVFDPRWIEKGDTAVAKGVDPVLYNQIVARDLYWLIHQVKRVVAYMPQVVLSAGLINEIRYAHETNKEVWLIYPKGERISPFITYYCDQIFSSPEQLLKFIKDGSGKERKAKSARSKKRKK